MIERILLLSLMAAAALLTACPDEPFCPPGAVGCECLEGETCLAGNRCEAAVCVAIPAPLTGTVGGSCDAQSRCGVDDVWGALDCVGGRCQPASCPLEALGCPCGPSERCEPFGGRLSSCMEGVCVPSSCLDEGAGSLGCPCDGGACSGDLQCVTGTCRQPAVGRVIVDSPAARSCEVLVRELGQTRVSLVRFGPEVRGREVQRGREIALSFIRREDAPFSGDVALFDAFPAPVGGGPGIELVRAQCADAAGAPIDAAEVRVQ